jgi:hypothetical protein
MILHISCITQYVYYCFYRLSFIGKKQHDLRKYELKVPYFYAGNIECLLLYN